jgi:hypothetical protein
LTLRRPHATENLDALTRLRKGKNMPAQIYYWSAVPLKDKPYNTANWAFGTEHAYGFPTDRDAWAVKAEYKDASGVEEKDGRFYVMKVVPS